MRHATQEQSKELVKEASGEELLWAWVHYDGMDCVLGDWIIDEHDLAFELIDRGYEIVIG